MNINRHKYLMRASIGIATQTLFVVAFILINYDAKNSFNTLLFEAIIGALGILIPGVLAFRYLVNRALIAEEKLNEVEKLRQNDASTLGKHHSIGAQLSKVVEELSKTTIECQHVIKQEKHQRSEGRHLINRFNGQVNAKSAENRLIFDSVQEAFSNLNKVAVQLLNIPAIMKRIKSESSSIDDIVFKTQLLSFNAFLEAARAGKTGHGFAVVAEEVSNLAENSEDISGKVNKMLVEGYSNINDIVEKVKARLTNLKSNYDHAMVYFEDLNSTLSDESKKILNSHLNDEQHLNQLSLNIERIDDKLKHIKRIVSTDLDADKFDTFIEDEFTTATASNPKVNTSEVEPVGPDSQSDNTAA